MEKIILNGSLIAKENAFLHVSDLSIHRGYGIFDFFKIKEGENPWLVHYLDRFYNSLKYANIPFSYSREDLSNLITEVMKANELESGYIKMVATGGYSVNGYTPSGEANFMMFSFPLNKFQNKPDGQGYNLITCEYLRPNPVVKSTNYFNSVMHYPKMQKFEAVDVLYHYYGLLSECSRCNIFIVKDNKIATPKSGMLEGITRLRVLEQVSNGFNVEVRDVNALEIFSADEIFISSSTKGIMPIVSIDGTQVRDGEVGPLSRELSSYLDVF